jgi:type I restriction enzyme R subunit
MDKKDLTERDICTRFITPSLRAAGWDWDSQFREEVNLTSGRVVVRGNKAKRDEKSIRRADYVLYFKPGIPIAVVEAKDNNHSIRDGIQQALAYAGMLDVPFAFSSNGDGFYSTTNPPGWLGREREIGSTNSPPPPNSGALPGLERHPARRRIGVRPGLPQPGKQPRYYQLNAINRADRSRAKGQRRILLVMATGTGKTYTAFQIIWRLWKARAVKRILFLADRNILIDQTKTNDFKPFGGR